MTLKQEIYQDIIDNCDVVLNLLRTFPATNDTAEGRMIYQCRWLKEQIAAGTLPLPVKDYIHTLRYVATDELLRPLASSPDRYQREIGVYLYRLLKLVKGLPLLKPTYYPQAVRAMDALLHRLRHASRPLNQFEQGAIDEIASLRQGLTDGSIVPAALEYLPTYKNLREVYLMNRSSVDDLPDCKFLMKLVNELIFEGVRPDSWTTPAAADQALAGL